MTGRHLHTWAKWLEELTVAKDFNETHRRSLAEALALAAPQGPKSFQCVDEGCEDHALRCPVCDGPMLKSFGGESFGGECRYCYERELRREKAEEFAR